MFFFGFKKIFLDLSELLCKRSVLAKLNDKTLWDINRPLEDSCSLKFLHFKDPNPMDANLVIFYTKYVN